VPKPLTIFTSINSTNKHAMEQISLGLAAHGQGFAALYQTNGQGQHGKNWAAQAGKNLLITVIANTSAIPIANMPLFNMHIAIQVYQFVKTFIPDNIAIKWPNDIIVNDRKAAGILIENKIVGSVWQWAVIGVGININQTVFTEGKPISLKQVCNQTFNLQQLQNQFYTHLCQAINNLRQLSWQNILATYNALLYKKDSQITLLLNNEPTNVIIKSVNANGQLIVYNPATQATITINHANGQWLL
jgi:BirA family transcriptional regulator, biotin operon repressor / biotin---[acetyl-CoA-carboxylase] ligase